MVVIVNGIESPFSDIIHVVPIIKSAEYYITIDFEIIIIIFFVLLEMISNNPFNHLGAGYVAIILNLTNLFFIEF